MKKLTAFVLALVMALGLLSGCGSSNSDSNTPSGDDASDAAAKTKLVVAKWQNREQPRPQNGITDLH